MTYKLYLASLLYILIITLSNTKSKQLIVFLYGPYYANQPETRATTGSLIYNHLVLAPNTCSLSKCSNISRTTIEHLRVFERNSKVL